ncbi:MULTISPECIES: group I intron-associated PD-(D/E)XK endonuclease [Helicobacter]|uniref:Group I intron-associated PD-(D/E)XK endonuclease n=1 Tax=Helicobacter ibis TaxID=2962633 RepID=A0ABT4VDC9_9HELI|nr:MULTISPECIES: group I intron-associated PD-(D/E)XK endonuclease [Helicobacter]MDA3967233.1 group I intron-associated PD-(D/E)XK endonuclease [Helicobacter sp. WB40]MDA3968699.1 group I intron-associated PD-(D/E)XK endonuclease [Helicobacter ibis]
MEDIENFTKEHIEAFNEKPSSFKNATPNETQIKDYLRTRYMSLLDNDSFKAKILQRFEKLDYKKNKIVDIANDEILYKADVERFLETQIFVEVAKKIDISKLKDVALTHIQEIFNNDKKFKFIQSKLSKVLEKSLFVASIDGFSTNLLNINSGVMTANAGDSAQFLFIARAILAGFNASNVDVRSSRYDAIVDFENILLRIQIKGISSGEVISFKDRDRGGQGIDHTHERNRGKRITSKDCDIYVAVDKQVGICYILPMSYADSLSDEECVKVKLQDIQKYKENWEIIKKVARQK